jgi:hypothetical protein
MFSGVSAVYKISIAHTEHKYTDQYTGIANKNMQRIRRHISSVPYWFTNVGSRDEFKIKVKLGLIKLTTM